MKRGGKKRMAYQIGKCLLSERLRQAGLSQVDFADRMKTDKQTVNKWVKGINNMSLVSAKNAVSILDLNCIDELYEWIPTNAPGK